jgi:hypothetical protein
MDLPFAFVGLKGFMGKYKSTVEKRELSEFNFNFNLSIIFKP